MTHLAGEGHQVMLAKTEDFNVLDNDELIVVFVEHRAVHDISQILLITFCEEHHSFCVPLGGTVQSLSIWVLANTFEKGAYSARQLFESLCSLFRS